MLFIIFPTYRQGSRQAKWLLAVASLICAFLLTEELLSHIVGYEQLPHLILSVGPLWYLLGPIIYFYVRLYSTQKKMSRKDLWHFLPPAWVLLSSLEFFSYSGDIKLYYYKMSSEGVTHPIHSLNFVIFSSQSLFYLIACWSLIKADLGQLRKKMEQTWIAQLVIGLGIIASMSFLSNVVLNVQAPNLWWVGSSYFIVVSAFLLILFVRSMKSPKELYLIGRPSLLNTNHSKADFEITYLKLLEFLEEQKPYRNPEFDLQTLAKQFGHSKHYLSRLIKESTDLNFRDFINKYRLEEAKKKLASTESKQFTIQSIANDSGFTSLATFYRAFKRLEGKPPKSFIS